MSTVLIAVLVVMTLPKPVPMLIKFVRAFIAALTNNPLLPNAAPVVAALTTALAALDSAETATKTRANGSIAARNTARAALKVQLLLAKAFVQQAANADPEKAVEIVTSTGLSTRKPTTRSKAPFEVKQGPTTGTVHLVAKAAAVRASYEWQWSSDGGKTWVALPVTLQAKTTLSGVAAGTNGLFRFRAVTRAGEGDWSQPVSFIVK
jgi:hypothetical protein